ncbi:MAG TPA: MFS transporter [Miltoncostaea sp.]|nr:MFS transporter [Miltoncostaea sp.]
MSATAVSRVALAVILAGAFAVYAAANAVVPLAAELRDQVGLGAGGAGPFLAPFALGFGIGSVLWFAGARARAPHVLLPAALAGTAAAGVLLVVAGSLPLAAAGRVLAGACAAGYPAVAQAVLASSAAPGRRGRAVGGFVVAVVLGSFGGQALAGGLAAVVPARAAIALVCVVLPLACAAALPAVLPAVAPAPAGTGATARIVREQWPVLTVAFLAFGAYWMLLAQLPAAVREERFSLSAAAAGLVPLAGILGAAAALATGALADRRGNRLAMTATLCAGAAGLALTVPAGPGLAVFVTGFAVFATGYWGYLPVAAAETVTRARPADRQGAVMALYAAMWSGAALASAAGTLLDSWTHAALAALIAWAAAVAVAAGTFTRGRHA